MQWPAWNTFGAGEFLLDCGTIAPSDMKNFLIKRAKQLRWKQEQIDETENDVWFEPSRTLLRRKCNEEWTQEKTVRGIGRSTERSRKVARANMARLNIIIARFVEGLERRITGCTLQGDESLEAAAGARGKAGGATR